MSKTIIAAAALLIPVSMAVAQAQESGTTITGRIVDVNTGVPIAGSATVFMNYDGSLVTDTAIAGEDGVFDLVVPTKPNRMLVWAENYAPKNIDDPSITEDIALAPLRIFTAKIVDWNGVPLANAPVYLRYGDAGGVYSPDWMIRGLQEQKLTTDSNGLLVVSGVLPNVPVLVHAEYQGARYRGDPLPGDPQPRANLWLAEDASQSERGELLTVVVGR